MKQTKLTDVLHHIVAAAGQLPAYHTAGEFTLSAKNERVELTIYRYVTSKPSDGPSTYCIRIQVRYHASLDHKVHQSITVDHKGSAVRSHYGDFADKYAFFSRKDISKPSAWTKYLTEQDFASRARQSYSLFVESDSTFLIANIPDTPASDFIEATIINGEAVQ